MSTPQIVTDPRAATLTLTTHFDAPVERVWEVVSDPRKLERWWGPPTYPATVVDHDLRPGGRVTYYMTSPEGEQYHGWWRVIEVSAPTTLRVVDGFGDDPDHAAEGMPTSTMTLTLAGEPDGSTLMSILSQFDSPEALQQVAAMGMEEGLAGAVSQIDGLLAEAAAA